MCKKIIRAKTNTCEHKSNTSYDGYFEFHLLLLPNDTTIDTMHIIITEYQSCLAQAFARI